MELSPQAKNAVKIGSLCSVSYFAVYIARNILGAVTPQMVEGGFTEAYIGKMSSLFFGFPQLYVCGRCQSDLCRCSHHHCWGWLILVWFGLMIVGVIIALPYKNTAKLAKMK